MRQIWVLAASAVVAFSAAAQDGADRVAWLTEHAAPIRSLQFEDEDFSDLAPLKAAIGGARVVMLGEQSHGDGACFAAKARLIRFLRQEMGFDVLAWESGLDDMRRVDRALAAGEPLEESFRHGLFGIWSMSQQVRPVLEYVKANRSGPRPLETAGFDNQVTGNPAKSPWPREVVEFFDKADASLLSAEQRAAPARVYEWLAGLKGRETPPPPEGTVERLREMAAMLEKPGEKMAAAHPAKEIGFTRRMLLGVADYALQRSNANVTSREENGRRDVAMGENLAFLAKEYYRDRKIIVWAASFHNARNLEPAEMVGDPGFYKGIRTMGHVAHQKLGDEIYSIMFVAHGGKIGRPWSEASDVPPCPEGSLDELMHKTGKPYLFLDFKGLPADHWLRKPMVARPLGYAEIRAEWPTIFDGVVFTDAMYPSTRVGVEPAEARPGQP